MGNQKPRLTAAELAGRPEYPVKLTLEGRKWLDEAARLIEKRMNLEPGTIRLDYPVQCPLLRTEEERTHARRTTS